MVMRRIRSYMCSHCGYEIATLYQTEQGQWLDASHGIRLTVSDASTGRAMLECPACLNQTAVNWREFQTKRLPVRAVVLTSEPKIPPVKHGPHRGS